jgi:hypothetical protein
MRSNWWDWAGATGTPWESVPRVAREKESGMESCVCLCSRPESVLLDRQVVDGNANLGRTSPPLGRFTATCVQRPTQCKRWGHPVLEHSYCCKTVPVAVQPANNARELGSRAQAPPGLRCFAAFVMTMRPPMRLLPPRNKRRLQYVHAGTDIT